MARGRDAHQAKKAALAALGKDLSRRARSKCELCTESGSLRPVPLNPDEEADLERTLLLCERCQTLYTTGRYDGLESLRFLEGAVWSELLPAQLVAIKLVERLADTVDASWPREAADGVWVDDDVRASVDALP